MSEMKPMSGMKLVLDHVGIAVASLDNGRDVWRRLGFTLTERSFHRGAIEPGGPVVTWGSGNHCAMLRDGYLEILGIYDPSLPSNAKKLIAKYEGAHIVAFGVDRPAEEAHAILAARHPAIRAPAALERMAPFGPEGREQRRAAFRNMYADPDVFDEGRYLFIEHLTRDVLWQPHLLDHPNGALALAEVAIASVDAEATASRLAAVLGAPAEDKGHGIRALDLARGRVYVLPGDMVGRWARGVVPPQVPYIAGIGIAVADLAATKALLDVNGVAWNAHPYPAVWVPPAHTCGPVVSFIQA